MGLYSTYVSTAVSEPVRLKSGRGHRSSIPAERLVAAELGDKTASATPTRLSPQVILAGVGIARRFYARSGDWQLLCMKATPTDRVAFMRTTSLALVVGKTSDWPRQR